MSARDREDYYDLLESRNREGFANPRDEARFERLHAQAQTEEDARPGHTWLGGDYPDL